MERVKEIKGKFIDAVSEVIENGERVWSYSENGVEITSLSDSRGNIVNRKELVWYVVNGVPVNMYLEKEGFNTIEKEFLSKVNHLRDKESTDIVTNNTERVLNSIISSPPVKEGGREMTKADWWQTARVVMLFICAVVLAVLFVSS